MSRSGQAPPSVRSLLVLLALFSGVPIAIMALVRIQLDFEEGRQALQQATLRTARALALAVDHHLAEVQAGLLGLASNPALAAARVDDFEQQARALQPALKVTNIVLSAPGKVLSNTLIPPPSHCPRSRARPWRPSSSTAIPWSRTSSKGASPRASWSPPACR